MERKVGKPLRMGRWCCNCEGIRPKHLNWCEQCDTYKPDELPPMLSGEREEVLKALTDQQREALSTELLYEQNQALTTDGERFAQLLSDFANNSSFEPRKICGERLARLHPTLQQGLMRFFLVFVENLAAQRTDLRNEAAVALAKRIMEIPVNERALPQW